MKKGYFPLCQHTFSQSGGSGCACVSLAVGLLNTRPAAELVLWWPTTLAVATVSLDWYVGETGRVAEQRQYFHFLLLYTSTPQQFEGKYCSFDSTVYLI